MLNSLLIDVCSQKSLETTHLGKTNMANHIVRQIEN